MFVHQAQWQRKLVEKYGNDIVLLDATYNTSPYALPVFFMAVATNVNFTVVGEFIIERETQDSIVEATEVRNFFYNIL